MIIFKLDSIPPHTFSIHAVVTDQKEKRNTNLEGKNGIAGHPSRTDTHY